MSKEKASKEKEVSPLENEKGLILWTDGSAQPTNPGPAGWGIHGYLFKAVKPKKGSGNPDQILTTLGYVPKPDFNKMDAPAIDEDAWAKILAGENKSFEITPIHYVDGYGAFTTESTNNAAELKAAIRGLEYALEYEIRMVDILTDSEYVRKGMTEWIKAWVKNNWIRPRDLLPVPNAELWKELLARRDQLEQRGVRVRFLWVKGHADHFGNQLADKLANVGSLTAAQHLRKPDATHSLSQLINSTAEGYWSYQSEKHPMLSHRFMYFNTDLEHLKPGEYYIGNEGKKEKLIGSRNADGAYAVVTLKTPDPVVEMVRLRQVELAEGNNTIILAYLSEIFSANTHRMLVNYGANAALRMNPYKPLDLSSLGREPITYELSPPRLAMRVVDAVGAMYSVLQSYLAKDERVVVTDLTPILYETTEKAVKKPKAEAAEAVAQTKLKDDYKSSFASLRVEARYQSTDGVKTAPVILVLGMDLVDRNTLKRLETSNPKVSLVTWLEAENVFRYATVIEAGEDLGIWAGWYSNTRVLAA